MKPSWGLIVGLLACAVAMVVTCASLAAKIDWPFAVGLPGAHAAPVENRVDLTALSDAELERDYQGAMAEWRRVAGSVTNIDAPHRTDEELASIHATFKTLRIERERRHAARNLTN